MSLSVHLCVQKKMGFVHYIKWKGSVCWGKSSEKSMYTLGSSQFHWNSGKSKATEIMVISVFTGQSSCRQSAHSAPQLSGLEQLSPQLPLCRDLRSNPWIWLSMHWAGFARRNTSRHSASQNYFNTNEYSTSNKYFVPILPIQNSLEICCLPWGPNACPAGKSTCTWVAFTEFLLLLNPETAQNPSPSVLQMFPHWWKSNCNYQHWLL